jgi:HSP20 family molecular chaperone IbpA
MEKRIQNQQVNDQSVSFCEYSFQRTPKYIVKEVDDGLMVEVELPLAMKENIHLDLGENNKMTLVVPFVNSIPQETKQMDQQQQQHIEDASNSNDEKKEGIVVIDEEEEEIKQKTKTEMTTTPQSTEPSTQCKIYGEYHTNFVLPKKTIVDGIQATFENEKLYIHLPQTQSQRRSIFIQ